MKFVLRPANSSIALKAKMGWTLNDPTGQLYHQTRVDQDLVMFKSETNIYLEVDELNSIYLKEALSKSLLTALKRNVRQRKMKLKLKLYWKTRVIKRKG